MILIIYKKEAKKYLVKVQEIINFFSKNFYIVVVEDLKKTDVDIFSQSELVIILGGDGTVLKALSEGNFKDKYILSINAGKVGFIASVSMDDAKRILQAFFEKNYEAIKMDKRYWLITNINEKNYRALNEISIHRGASARMLSIKAFFNGVATLQFRADGLIIATSTGSTAYNLSASGPIVHPDIMSLIFNPICPYSLTLKPIVIPQNDQITVEVEFKRVVTKFRNQNFCVTFDGQTQLEYSGRTNLKFYLSNDSVCFMRLKGENYYTTLQKKIYWGRGFL